MNDLPFTSAESAAANKSTSEAAAKASENLVDLTAYGEGLLSTGKDKICEAGRQVMTTVRKHPIESAAIAALAVFAVWSLIKGK